MTAMNIVRLYASFDDLPLSYQPLFSGSATDNFFLSYDWFRLLEKTVLKPDWQLRLYGVETGNGIARALLPMSYSLNPDNARKLEASSNFYTPIFQPLVASGFDLSQAIHLFAEAIRQDSPRWNSVHFFPLEYETAMQAILRKEFLRNGMWQYTYLSSANWYLRVARRDYNTYFSELPSKLRNTLTRKARTLNANYSFSFRIFQGCESTQQALADYQYVYTHSWKEPEIYPEFIPALIRLCADNGSLRLGIAYIDQQAVAAQFWIVHGGTASIYKLAYHREYSTLSIGSLLTAQLMRHVIDIDRVSVVDFLTGDDAYKRDWMSHRRERYGVMFFNLRTIGGQLKAGKHFCKALVKYLLPGLRARSTKNN